MDRFAYGNSLRQNQIPVRILGFFGQTFGLAEAARRTFACLEKSGLSVTATQIPYSGKHQGSDFSVKAEKKRFQPTLMRFVFFTSMEITLIN